MNNSFNYQGFQITVQTINLEPWFLAKDIANFLNLKNPSMMIRYSKTSKDFVKKITTKTLRGKQKMLYININGLNNILKHCKKQKTSILKDWIKEQF